MVEERVLRRIGPGQYQVVEGMKTIDYDYHPSKKMEEIIERVSRRFPFLDFQIWKSIQYNYFANHQISNNIIFFETDKMSLESVFEFLKNECNQDILIFPSMREYRRYADTDTIIMQSSVTEAPIDKKRKHLVPIEKLLIDTLTNRIVALLFSLTERNNIAEEILLRYNVNIAKARRYAKRRNVGKKLEAILEKPTMKERWGEYR